MRQLRSRGLWAGIALIVVTNALVLVGVARNRSGAPDSTLRLSQRELAPPFEWGMAKENSGLSLQILDRVAGERLAPIPANADFTEYSYLYLGPGEPDWLDDARVAAMGIDVKWLRAHADARHGGAPTSKEVLFVLELDGPAYAAALAQARQRRDEEAVTAAANPGKEEFVRRAKYAADAALFAERHASRLFVVDAGLDRDALRAKYPDRRRHAVVRGILQPVAASIGRPVARIDRLSIDTVTVPHEFHGTLGPLLAAEKTRPRDQPRGEFEATVAWGSHLEPWIVDTTARQLQSPR